MTRPETLGPALDGVDAVVHLVAIPRDLDGGADLRLVNTEGTRARGRRDAARPASGGSSTWARWASSDDRDLHYASSKAKAEALVRASGLDWTILKPSLQFGEGDGFFNIVAGPRPDLARDRARSPGDGTARFQPIHVGDVARSSSASLADPTTIGGASSSAGRATGPTRRSPAR